MTHFIAGMLQGLFWLVALGLSLWIVRRFAPTLEKPLFDVGASEGIGIIARRLRAQLQSLRH